MTIYCYGLDFCSQVCQSYHVKNRKCIYYVQKRTEILYEWRSMYVNLRLFLLFTFGIPATIIGNQLRNKIN